MPKAGEQENSAEQDVWSNADFAFALRELREEFPERSTEEIASALSAAEQTLPSLYGRVRLVELARELVRAQ